MTYFILGLFIFLGTHSIRIFADNWRSSQISRLGANSWKLAYSLASVLGFGLLLWGFALARTESSMIWNPPPWTSHAAALLTIAAFMLMVAAYVPKNSIKAGVGHPMVLSVAFWAVAHLLANGRLVDLLLFGTFFLWAVLDYRASVQRDKKAHASYPVGTLLNTALTVVVGSAGWALFAGFLHVMLFGVRPFG